MQRVVGKIVLNGNSSQITLKRPILSELGWLPSEHVILTTTPDKKLIVQRLEDAIAESNARIREAVHAPVEVKA